MAEATLSDIKDQLVESVDEQQETNTEVRNLNKKFGLWMKNQDKRLDRERLANLELLREMKKLAAGGGVGGAGGMIGGFAAPGGLGVLGEMISGGVGALIGATLLPLLRRMSKALLALTGIPAAIRGVKNFFGIGKDGPDAKKGFFERIKDSVKSTFDDLVERVKGVFRRVFDTKLGGRLGRIIAGIGGILAFFKISVPDFERRRGTGSPMGRGGAYPETDTTPPRTPARRGEGRGTGSPMGRGGAYPKTDTTPPRSETDRARAKKEIDEINPKYGRLKKFLGIFLTSAPFLALDVIEIVSVVNSDVSEDKKIEEIGAILGGIAGAAALGALAGAVAAAWTGPIGSFIVGTIGAIAGGILGDKLGRIIARYLLKNTPPSDKDVDDLKRIRSEILRNAANFLDSQGAIVGYPGIGLPSTNIIPQNKGSETENNDSSANSAFTGDNYQTASSGDDWKQSFIDRTTPRALYIPFGFSGELGSENFKPGFPVAAEMNVKPGAVVTEIPEFMKIEKNREDTAIRKYPSLKKLFWFLTALSAGALIPSIVGAANEDISDQEKAQKIAKIIGPDLAGIIVGLILGKTGAAVGGFTGPAAGIVSPILGAAGGFVGYYIGSKYGSEAAIKLAAWGLGLIKITELLEWARASLSGAAQAARTSNLGLVASSAVDFGAEYFGIDKKNFGNRMRAGTAGAAAAFRSGKGLVAATAGLAFGFLTGQEKFEPDENPIRDEILRNTANFLNNQNAIVGYPGIGLPSTNIAVNRNNRGRELNARSVEMEKMMRSGTALAFAPVVNAPSNVQNNQNTSIISQGQPLSFDRTYEPF